jgi:hypothetical protein
MKRWRVGDVQRLGAGGATGETWGVALYDETGKPCVTFDIRRKPTPRPVVSTSRLRSLAWRL